VFGLITAHPSRGLLFVTQVWGDLNYSFILSIREGKQVMPVLVLERAPADGRWSDLCRRHGVLLVWPDTFGELGSAMPGADNRGTG